MEAVLEQIEINLMSVFNTTKVFLKYLSRGSAILNVSSFAGLLGLAGYTAYAASKYGVIGFSDALRRELKSRGISVQVACPMVVFWPLCFAIFRD